MIKERGEDMDLVEFTYFIECILEIKPIRWK